MAKTLILYHGNCPDGFGGAYAAWKKFGSGAEYVPLKHERPIPADAAGKDVYFIDFFDRNEFVGPIIEQAARVVVLDHHEGIADVVQAMPEHVYDPERSGATIAWNYFHPDKPVPYFLKLVQETDNFKPLTDNERATISYCYAQPWSFELWDSFVERVEDSAERQKIIELGRAYNEHFKLLVAQFASRAQLVSFEGHEVYFVSAPRLFATELGAQLREKHPPFAMIARDEADGSIRVSLRGVKEFDVSAIARKYGGNGHPGSAAFSLPRSAPLPWTPLPDHENPGD
jgi:hypothetical protein